MRLPGDVRRSRQDPGDGAAVDEQHHDAHGDRPRHVQLGPDNYDRIKSWRVSEVTCDDPGLSKPAYLASKNAESINYPKPKRK